MRRAALAAALAAMLPAAPAAAWPGRHKGPLAEVERDAAKGDPHAQLLLADWHRGLGTPADSYRAYMWAQAAILSAQTNDDPESRAIVAKAGAIRDQLSAALSSDELLRAHAEASARVEDAPLGGW